MSRASTTSWLQRLYAAVETSQPWGVEQPSNLFLLEYLLLLSLLSIAATVAFKSLRKPSDFVKACGVHVKRVKRTMQEIDRKVFHLCTLLVPLTHQVLLQRGWSNDECVALCWAITTTGCSLDLARVYGPAFVRRHWPLQHLLREKEKERLTGSCFLALGCTLTIAIAPPSIAMAAVLFLVLGDLSAAVVGVSFGKETVSLKLGREGKKSAEGSIAMFVVCFLVGCTLFAHVELREYSVAIGAIVATLTELIEPFGLNDNLTIPVFSAISLMFGFSRVASCHIQSGGGVALLREIFSHFDGR